MEVKHYFQPKKVNHYDPLIHDYLSQHKSLSLEKIGILTTDEKISSAYHLPLVFQFDKKIKTTPELIDYIAERIGKSKVLIQADIESYTETMRQLMNIGKPYEIEGVGTFKLAMSGEYEFSVYEVPSGKEEHKQARRHQPGELLPANKKSSNKTVLVFISIIIIAGILGVIGWGAYNFFENRAQNGITEDSSVMATAPPVVDSGLVNADSSSSLNDTLKKDTIKMLQTDTVVYKFIYETTFLEERARSRTAQLARLGQQAEFDSISTNAGQLYRLYIKKRLFSADTTREKNFLRGYLQRDIQVVTAD